MTGPTVPQAQVEVEGLFATSPADPLAAARAARARQSDARRKVAAAREPYLEVFARLERRQAAGASRDELSELRRQGWALHEKLRAAQRELDTAHAPRRAKRGHR